MISLSPNLCESKSKVHESCWLYAGYIRCLPKWQRHDSKWYDPCYTGGVFCEIYVTRSTIIASFLLISLRMSTMEKRESRSIFCWIVRIYCNKQNSAWRCACALFILVPYSLILITFMTQTCKMVIGTWNFKILPCPIVYEMCWQIHS